MAVYFAIYNYTHHLCTPQQSQITTFKSVYANKLLHGVKEHYQSMASCSHIVQSPVFLLTAEALQAEDGMTFLFQSLVVNDLTVDWTMRHTSEQLVGSQQWMTSPAS